jgi:hypothetical protein
MAFNQSNAAIMFALEDAKADILELYAENKRIREVMRIIAYPKRGTHEEGYDLQDMANLIQLEYTAAQLSE